MNQCQTDKQATMDPRSSDALVTICYNRQADKPRDFDRKQFVRWNDETRNRALWRIKTCKTWHFSCLRSMKRRREVWQNDQKVMRNVVKKCEKHQFRKLHEKFVWTLGRSMSLRHLVWTLVPSSVQRCHPASCVVRVPRSAQSWESRGHTESKQHSAISAISNLRRNLFQTCFKPVSNLHRRSLLEVGTSFAVWALQNVTHLWQKHSSLRSDEQQLSHPQKSCSGVTLCYTHRCSLDVLLILLCYFFPRCFLSLSFERPVLNWINKYCKKWMRLGNGHAKRRLKDI